MSRWARRLTNAEPSPQLDLSAYVGQRVESFRFEVLDIVTGYREELHPLRDSVATLTHDVTRTIVRQISNFNLGVADTRKINVIRSRVLPFALFAGGELPLGRYMFSNQTRVDTTSGRLSNATLYDEGFIVDQQLDRSFSGTSQNPLAANARATLINLLEDLPLTLSVAESTFNTANMSWPSGTSRGYVVQQLALDGDYLPPWFTNEGVMTFIRAFDPATAVPTFNLDEGARVVRDTVAETDDLIDAPNRFVVVSNAGEAGAAEIVGRFDLPASAPHSIANRGFVVPLIVNRQVTSVNQANAVARNLGLRQVIFEEVELSTAIDPRHDGYDVIRWRGENWLETAWSIPFKVGANMTHTARKTYTE